MNKLLLIILLFSSYFAFSQDMTKDTIKLKELSVYGSLKATNLTPFSFNNITSEKLLILPSAEPAYVLSTTPSITFYSDNGSNFGYVYYRLRGIDQTRLNVTLNGVPLNEPEDQGSYFNNFPNFLSLINNIQIIRGSGVSKVGTATFGGSLNFESGPTNNSIVEWDASYGSNSTRVSKVSIGTEHLFFGLSGINTNGYKYHSDNTSTMFDYGSNFKLFGQKTKLLGIVGRQQNGMAWVGETLEQLKIDPRSNSNKKGERDNFLTLHNQLTFENNSIRNSKITYTFYYQYQNGYYDTDISLFDPSLNEGEMMSRIKLIFNWYGFIYNQSYSLNNLHIDYGINYSHHNRQHIGSTSMKQSDFIQDYTNHGLKQELSEYVKVQYKLKDFTLYGDIQNRYINFKYFGNGYEHILYNNSNINYSSGITYTFKNNILHLGYGKTFREPRRSDIFGGLDDYNGPINTLKDESVNSLDFGYKYINDTFVGSINFYNMNFSNEFMPTGEYGQNGIALYTNVYDSYRRGIEFSTSYKGNKIETFLNLSVSKNKFYIGKWYYSILSPSTVGNLNIKYNITKTIYLGINTRYNSSTYIDLTNQYKLPEFYVLDGYIGREGKLLGLQLNLNNITNSFILTNGMIGFDGSPRYFIMNKFNSLFTVKIKL